MKAAGDEWRAEPAVSGVLAGLERFGTGAPLEACPALEAALASPLAGAEFAASLCRRFGGLLAREHLGHLPFRHAFDGWVSTLLLARAGRAQLVLHAREPGHRDYLSASFSDALRYEAVLAGFAEARIVRLNASPGRVALANEAVELSAGTRLALDLSCEVLQVQRVERRLVSLRLDRFAAEPRPSREYAVESGALVHQSAGDVRASRHEMMVALLGRLGRVEAAPEMAALACGRGDDSLRWQALRECLALDTAEGFRALCAIARGEGDALAPPAGALRAQLVEAHPQLLAVEGAECRA